MDAHVTFVLDSSGSMSRIREDTIGGFNTFLEDQRAEEGRASVTLYEFADSVELVYEGRAIENAPELDTDSYVPGGGTALHDAIFTAVTETDRYLAQMPARVSPATVVVVVLTDGRENASETPQETVRDLVESHTDDGLEFLFIGANQDAALTAVEMGIDRDQSLDMSHSGEGAREAYVATSRNVSEARRTGSVGGYDAEDRRKQEDADGSTDD